MTQTCNILWLCMFFKCGVRWDRSGFGTGTKLQCWNDKYNWGEHLVKNVWRMKGETQTPCKMRVTSWKVKVWKPEIKMKKEKKEKSIFAQVVFWTTWKVFHDTVEQERKWALMHLYGKLQVVTFLWWASAKDQIYSRYVSVFLFESPRN